jgi:hypothetical protein
LQPIELVVVVLVYGHLALLGLAVSAVVVMVQRLDAAATEPQTQEAAEVAVISNQFPLLRAEEAATAAPAS